MWRHHISSRASSPFERRPHKSSTKAAKQRILALLILCGDHGNEVKDGPQRRAISNSPCQPPKQPISAADFTSLHQSDSTPTCSISRACAQSGNAGAPRTESAALYWQWYVKRLTALCACTAGGTSRSKNWPYGFWYQMLEKTKMSFQHLQSLHVKSALALWGWRGSETGFLLGGLFPVYTKQKHKSTKRPQNMAARDPRHPLLVERHPQNQSNGRKTENCSGRARPS